MTRLEVVTDSGDSGDSGFHGEFRRALLVYWASSGWDYAMTEGVEHAYWLKVRRFAPEIVLRAMEDIFDERETLSAGGTLRKGALKYATKRPSPVELGEFVAARAAAAERKVAAKNNGPPTERKALPPTQTPEDSSASVAFDRAFNHAQAAGIAPKTAFGFAVRVAMGEEMGAMFAGMEGHATKEEIEAAMAKVNADERAGEKKKGRALDVEIGQ